MNSVVYDRLNVGVKKVEVEVEGEKCTWSTDGSSNTPIVHRTPYGRGVESIGRGVSIGEGDSPEKQRCSNGESVCSVVNGSLEISAEMGMVEGRERDEVRGKGRMKAWAKFRRFVRSL